jgi:SAM-dependent methyltransferase
MKEIREINEQERILLVYRGRQQQDGKQPGFFGYENLAHYMRIQERHRKTLMLLQAAGYHTLEGLDILDIGCGDGNMLRQFLQWGGAPENMAGIELREAAVEKSHQLSPDLDVRCGSATELPWPDSSFDLVCQHTVFTSILDAGMKKKVTSEMLRVLRDGGGVLWYDFMYDNPQNPDVLSVKKAEIKALFPNCQYHLCKITLAPPIARRIPESLLPIFYPLLAVIPILRTHYLGILIKSN